MSNRAVRPLLAGAGLAALWAVLALAAPVPAMLKVLSDLPAAAQSAGPDALASEVAAAACWAALAWLTVALGATVFGARACRGARLARGLAALTMPASMRRVLAVAIGLTVVTGAATPALAAGAGSRPPGVVTAVSSNLDLDWPVTLRQPAQRPTPPAPVVVVSGDTLWALARHQLPAGATDSAVAVAWPRWYAANRSVIGPDPDLLLPGQRLFPPIPPTGEMP
ncbi:MAG: LysM domain-containing protein [Pseudonocardiales bacterium]